MGPEQVGTEAAASPLALTSPHFEEGGEIPRKFTGEGDDLSPALSFSPPPPGTKSFVLVCDDPDAPDPAMPRQRFVHWVLYNLPASTRELPEGVSASDLPRGSREGRNDGGTLGYTGPMPPIGRHRYFFALYALDTLLPDTPSMTRDQVLEAIQGHVLGQAELVGTYQRTQKHS